MSPNYPSNPPPHPRRSRASFGHDIGIRTSARSHNWACNDLPAVAFHQRGTQGATAAVVRSEDAGATPWSAKPLARPVSTHVPFRRIELLMRCWKPSSSLACRHRIRSVGSWAPTSSMRGGAFYVWSNALYGRPVDLRADERGLIASTSAAVSPLRQTWSVYDAISQTYVTAAAIVSRALPIAAAREDQPRCTPRPRGSRGCASGDALLPRGHRSPTWRCRGGGDVCP